MEFLYVCGLSVRHVPLPYRHGYKKTHHASVVSLKKRRSLNWIWSASHVTSPLAFLSVIFKGLTDRVETKLRPSWPKTQLRTSFTKRLTFWPPGRVMVKRLWWHHCGMMGVCWDCVSSAGLYCSHTHFCSCSSPLGGISFFVPCFHISYLMFLFQK